MSTSQVTFLPKNIQWPSTVQRMKSKLKCNSSSTCRLYWRYSTFALPQLLFWLPRPPSAFPNLFPTPHPFPPNSLFSIPHIKPLLSNLSTHVLFPTNSNTGKKTLQSTPPLVFGNHLFPPTQHIPTTMAFSVTQHRLPPLQGTCPCLALFLPFFLVPP